MKQTIAVLAAAGVLLFAGGALAGQDAQSGEALFQQHCTACHADGGNIINPKKTLNKSDLEANGVNSVEAIVNLMRNPGPGMMQFDESTLSDEQAKKIAEYILATY